MNYFFWTKARITKGSHEQYIKSVPPLVKLLTL